MSTFPKNTFNCFRVFLTESTLLIPLLRVSIGSLLSKQVLIALNKFIPASFQKDLKDPYVKKYFVNFSLLLIHLNLDLTLTPSILTFLISYSSFRFSSNNS